jgi:hypothetical protein
MSTQLEKKLEDFLTENEEPRYAHYADSVSVTEGYVLGKSVLALCGKLFVPSRDPQKFPICPACKTIIDALYLKDN